VVGRVSGGRVETSGGNVLIPIVLSLQLSAIRPNFWAKQLFTWDLPPRSAIRSSVCSQFSLSWDTSTAAGGMGVKTGRWKRPDRNGYDNGRIHQRRTARVSDTAELQAGCNFAGQCADRCKYVAELLAALTCDLLATPDHRLTTDICQRPSGTEHTAVVTNK